MSKLRNKAVKGVKWTAINSIANVILGPVTLTILARVLSPIEYGYIAIVTILIGFSRQIATMGFSQAIIQKNAVDNKDLDSIFWFEQAIGIITFLIIFFSAHYISNYFNSPETIVLIKYSSLIFLLEPFDLVFRTLLKKELKFDILTKSSLIKLGLQKGSTLILAFSGYGAMSFVIGNIVGVLSLTIIMIFIFIKNKLWFPNLYFSFSKLKPYLKFGSFIMGKSIFNNLFVYIDEIIIGGILGAETLGVYHLAKRMITYLTKIINVPLSEVSFPLLSKKASELKLFNKIYIKIIKLNALLSIPAHIGIAVSSSLFVPLLFGHEWSQAGVIISILAFWGMFKILYANIISGAMYSLGNSKWIFYATVIDLPFRATLLYMGSLHGMVIIAVLLVVIALIKFILYQYLLSRITDIEVIEIFKSIKIILISGLIMGLTTIMLKLVLLNWLSSSMVLVTLIFVGIFIYLILIYIKERDFLYYSISLIKKTG